MGTLIKSELLGGLIGLIIGILVRIFQSILAPCILIYPTPLTCSSLYYVFNTTGVVTTFSFLIIGLLLGAIIGKFKSNKEVRNKK